MGQKNMNDGMILSMGIMLVKHGVVVRLGCMLFVTTTNNNML